MVGVVPMARDVVRGERVVQLVLEAALKELAEVGYGALRMEDVAERAGVNKTTVYRRWPTKQELVRAALQSVTVDRVVHPNTGSLRGDLLAMGRHIADQMRSHEVQGLRRAMMVGERDPELIAIAKSLFEALQASPRPVIDAALARGELAKGINPFLIVTTLAAGIEHRLFMERTEVDDAYLKELVELLLVGALSAEKRT